MWNQKDFIERAQKLAIEKNTNFKQITKELGISPSSFTDWKKGRAVPSIEKICKIADYFDVSLDYLAYGKQDNKVDISNYQDPYSSRYNALPPDMQKQVITYMDGMLAVLNLPSEKLASS